MSDFDDSSDDYPMVDRPNSRMPSPVAPEDGASDEFTAPGRDDDTSARRGSNQSLQLPPSRDLLGHLISDRKMA